MFQSICRSYVKTSLKPQRHLAKWLKLLQQMEHSTKKTKELIALALAVGSRCDACIGFHTKALVKLGATEQEIAETLGMCIYMGGGPSMMYAAEAVASFNEFKNA